MKPDLSLALGSYEVQPMELAGAYATFAAGGIYEEPHLVMKIVGPDGKEVRSKPRPPPRRVLDESEAFVTTSMLTSVIDHGTAARAKSLGRPLAGKTGTSNASKDTWFAGYSPEICAVVWIGYDDGKSLGGRRDRRVSRAPRVDGLHEGSRHEHKPAATSRDQPASSPSASTARRASSRPTTTQTPWMRSSSQAPSPRTWAPRTTTQEWTHGRTNPWSFGRRRIPPQAGPRERRVGIFRTRAT